ncbi:MAG: holo-[acyl-carrier-protein] synthase [Planctomyces sp.]|nr:holo-[acyl-carrier-protein] synthase [Planctomyces sp.]
MRIVGHGIDLAEVARVAGLLAQHRERFLERVYTAAEAAACQGERRRAERLALRFAAKEAVLKALGTGLTRGIAWTDVEVASLPSGKPVVRLHNAAARVAAELGVTRWELSLSDAGAWAMASVIAIAE